MSVEIPIKIVNTIDPEQYAGLVGAITKLTSAVLALKPKYHFEGGGFVRTYAEDRPDETVTFRKPKVVDSEGGEVDPQPDLTYTFSSDKPNICDVTSSTDNGDGTVAVGLHYEKAVKLPDNSYDMAELKAESNDITLPDGSTLKDVKTEQVQLVPGVAAGFAGGGFELPV